MRALGKGTRPSASEAPSVCQADATTVGLPLGEDVTADTLSEASEMLLERVRESREKAEELRKELELLEGCLESMENMESVLRERADRLITL